VSDACPICGTQETITFDCRPRVPVLQNRVWRDRSAAWAAPVGKLEMVSCTTCGFAWNRAFDSESLIYDPEYDNDQMESAAYGMHVEAMVRRVLDSVSPDADTHLVEVGCGQGAFLRRLALTNKFASLTGFDPAYRGEEGACVAGVTIHRRLFGSAALGLLPHSVQLVVSRHTIEHISQPLAFLNTIRATMETIPAARLFLETPDFAWILKRFQPQDLFYEHCSIFSPEALCLACSVAGFKILSLEPVFGDQYLWAEAKPVSDAIGISPKSFLARTAESFSAKRDLFVEDWRRRISALGANKAVWIWGAASKGVTFALLIDPAGTRLAGAIDINPNKIGRFMPVTGLPICGPDAVANGDVVIIMNSNYRNEIAAQIDARNISVGLLTLDLASPELSV
jgi:hypothetical protein